MTLLVMVVGVQSLTTELMNLVGVQRVAVELIKLLGVSWNPFIQCVTTERVKIVRVQHRTTVLFLICQHFRGGSWIAK